MTRKLKMHPSIQLSSGLYFDFLNPDSTPLHIKDIAAGLSRTCRYTGHLRDINVDLYSVAQHCVLASENGPPGDPFEFLMHDSAESVIGDVSSPLKQLLDDYKVIEDRVEESLAKQYGLPRPMSAACKAIDLRMLATEKRDLMPGDNDGEYWAIIEGVEPLPFVIKPWSRAESYYRFLHRYYYLTTGKMPKPTLPFAQPHDDVPQDYLKSYYDYWLNDEHCLAAGIRQVVVGTRLPRHAWVEADTAVTTGMLAGLDPLPMETV